STLPVLRSVPASWSQAQSDRHWSAADPAAKTTSGERSEGSLPEGEAASGSVFFRQISVDVSMLSVLSFLSRFDHLTPAPLIDIIHYGPVMSLMVDFLFCDLMSVRYPVEMINIDQPYPRNISILCYSGSAVPLCFLPEIIRYFQIT